MAEGAIDVPVLYERLGREYHARLVLEEDLERLRGLWAQAVQVLAGIKSGAITLDRLEVTEDGFRVLKPQTPSNITDLKTEPTSAD